MLQAHQLTAGGKVFGHLPPFDPDGGDVIVEPPGSGYGYWAGAPSALFDNESCAFYLCYRRRWPLGGRRGGECAIARSEDGVHFQEIWKAQREQFGANSIEKSAIFRDPSGEWRLYVSSDIAEAYDRNPPTWRIDLMQADDPAKFDPLTRRVVLDAPMFGFSHVKDPTVNLIGNEYFVYTSVGRLQQYQHPDAQGVIRPAGRGMIALHRSPDGVYFPTAEVIMEPNAVDTMNVRASSVVYVAPLWYLIYDGGPTRADSYDEFTRLAAGFDPLHFSPVSGRVPWVASSHASGSIRYVDAIRVEGTIHYYYEYARADRAHELRHVAVALR
jgi:hypothetical protein